MSGNQRNLRNRKVIVEQPEAATKRQAASKAPRASQQLAAADPSIEQAIASNEGVTRQEAVEVLQEDDRSASGDSPCAQ